MKEFEPNRWMLWWSQAATWRWGLYPIDDRRTQLVTRAHLHAVLGEQFHWIAPSRFGYLRSTFHDGATFDDQAHAYAYLLDRLGVKRVAVVALSHGGPSALLFAVLHPERVSSLTLISCGIAAPSTQDQAQANQQGGTLVSIFKYDLPYWLITKLFRKQFLGLMGANDAVIADLTPQQRAMAERFVDYMNPVSLRSTGVAFDNKAALPGERIAAIRDPTLIFHAADDTLQLYHNAEFAASTIPGARLVRFESGGICSWVSSKRPSAQPCSSISGTM